jgi:hypothetical protein
MGADREIENRVIGSPGHRKSEEEATKVCAKKYRRNRGSGDPVIGRSKGLSPQAVTPIVCAGGSKFPILAFLFFVA